MFVIVFDRSESAFIHNTTGLMHFGKPSIGKPNQSNPPEVKAPKLKLRQGQFVSSTLSPYLPCFKQRQNPSQADCLPSNRQLQVQECVPDLPPHNVSRPSYNPGASRNKRNDMPKQRKENPGKNEHVETKENVQLPLQPHSC